VSGFAGPFTFYGFLASKGSRRRQQLRDVAATAHTAVLYEAPHRLQQTLQQLADLHDGEGATRELAWCREMTKQYEDVRRGTVSDALGWAAAGGGDKVRGEFCLVLGPHKLQVGYSADTHTLTYDGTYDEDEDEGEGEGDVSADRGTVVQSALQALHADGVPRSEAVRLVCDMHGLSRGRVYKAALAVRWE
jgi:16S rRNA C1402 (ribose-2'-O) methylase RsmI